MVSNYFKHRYVVTSADHVTSCDIMWVHTQDPNGMELMVGITHVGVVVFHHKRKVNTYEWWGMIAFTIGGVFNSGIVYFII